MSLSPYGSSAVVTGSLRKGIPMMLLGGVLAWVSGQSWRVERGDLEVFPVLMALGTIVTVAVPAQLVAGPRGKAWMMAAAGALGAAVPWFFSLAVEREGRGMLVPSLVILVVSFLVTYAACRLTRSVLRRAA